MSDNQQLTLEADIPRCVGSLKEIDLNELPLRAASSHFNDATRLQNGIEPTHSSFLHKRSASEDSVGSGSYNGDASSQKAHEKKLKHEQKRRNLKLKRAKEQMGLVVDQMVQDFTVLLAFQEYVHENIARDVEAFAQDLIVAVTRREVAQVVEHEVVSGLTEKYLVKELRKQAISVANQSIYETQDSIGGQIVEGGRKGLSSTDHVMSSMILEVIQDCLEEETQKQEEEEQQQKGSWESELQLKVYEKTLQNDSENLFEYLFDSVFDSEISQIYYDECLQVHVSEQVISSIIFKTILETLEDQIQIHQEDLKKGQEVDSLSQIWLKEFLDLQIIDCVNQSININNQLQIDSNEAATEIIRDQVSEVVKSSLSEEHLKCALFEETLLKNIISQDVVQESIMEQHNEQAQNLILSQQILSQQSSLITSASMHGLIDEIIQESVREIQTVDLVCDSILSHTIEHMLSQEIDFLISGEQVVSEIIDSETISIVQKQFYFKEFSDPINQMISETIISSEVFQVAEQCFNYMNQKYNTSQVSNSQQNIVNDKMHVKVINVQVSNQDQPYDQTITQKKLFQKQNSIDSGVINEYTDELEGGASTGHMKLNSRRPSKLQIDGLQQSSSQQYLRQVKSVRPDAIITDNKINQSQSQIGQGSHHALRSAQRNQSPLSGGSKLQQPTRSTLAAYKKSQNQQQSHSNLRGSQKQSTTLTSSKYGYNQSQVTNSAHQQNRVYQLQMSSATSSATKKKNTLGMKNINNFISSSPNSSSQLTKQSQQPLYTKLNASQTASRLSPSPVKQNAYSRQQTSIAQQQRSTQSAQQVKKMVCSQIFDSLLSNIIQKDILRQSIVIQQDNSDSAVIDAQKVREQLDLYDAIEQSVIRQEISKNYFNYLAEHIQKKLLHKVVKRDLYNLIQDAVDTIYYLEEDTISMANTILDNFIKSEIVSTFNSLQKQPQTLSTGPSQKPSHNQYFNKQSNRVVYQSKLPNLKVSHHQSFVNSGSASHHNRSQQQISQSKSATLHTSSQHHSSVQKKLSSSHETGVSPHKRQNQQTQKMTSSKVPGSASSQKNKYYNANNSNMRQSQASGSLLNASSKQGLVQHSATLKTGKNNSKLETKNNSQTFYEEEQEAAQYLAKKLENNAPCLSDDDEVEDDDDCIIDSEDDEHQEQGELAISNKNISTSSVSNNRRLMNSISFHGSGNPAQQNKNAQNNLNKLHSTASHYQPNQQVFQHSTFQDDSSYQEMSSQQLLLHSNSSLVIPRQFQNKSQSENHTLANPKHESTEKSNQVSPVKQTQNNLLQIESPNQLEMQFFDQQQQRYAQKSQTDRLAVINQSKQMVQQDVQPRTDSETQPGYGGSHNSQKGKQDYSQEHIQQNSSNQNGQQPVRFSMNKKLISKNSTSQGAFFSRKQSQVSEKGHHTSELQLNHNSGKQTPNDPQILQNSQSHIVGVQALDQNNSANDFQTQDYDMQTSMSQRAVSVGHGHGSQGQKRQIVRLSIGAGQNQQAQIQKNRSSQVSAADHAKGGDGLVQSQRVKPTQNMIPKGPSGDTKIRQSEVQNNKEQDILNNGGQSSFLSGVSLFFQQNKSQQRVNQHQINTNLQQNEDQDLQQFITLDLKIFDNKDHQLILSILTNSHQRPTQQDIQPQDQLGKVSDNLGQSQGSQQPNENKLLFYEQALTQVLMRKKDEMDPLTLETPHSKLKFNALFNQIRDKNIDSRQWKEIINKYLDKHLGSHTRRSNLLHSQK